MRIRPSERQEITDICREELDIASQRISERLSHFDERPASASEDKLETVRKFYEDLADKNWTKADEDALHNLADLNERQIKNLMREGHRKASLSPVPNFAYLIHTAREEDVNPHVTGSLANLEAVSAAERERLASVLETELSEAVQDIAFNLQLTESKADLVRKQLQLTQGNIIGRLTPLA
jgi:hypothetical protein